MSQSAFRIYRDDTLSRRGSPWRTRVPAPSIELPVDVCAPVPEPELAEAELHAIAPVPAAIEQAMLAILNGPSQFGECLSATFRRKEHELGAIFAALTVTEAYGLHARLVTPVAADRFATRFALLVPERRARLLTFLADARRRETVQLVTARASAR